MKVINHQFITQNRTRQFIEQSINVIISANDSVRSDKKYWLYYYVKTDYDMILNSLLNYDIASDFLGFPNQQKVIRHQIEAFIDLYNLCHDHNYEAVLRKNNHENVDISSYERYLGRSAFFSTKQKIKIASDNGFQYSSYLEEFTQNSNQYVHPMVYIKPIDEEEKERLLREIINLSDYLLVEAYALMLTSFSDGAYQPRLYCMNCGDHNMDCGACFNNLVSEDRSFVSLDEELFVECDSQACDFNIIYD